ncbi:MAG: orange carotenoid protein N-terminal domain-containing protein, partial [Cyanobacteria bacterium J06641_5]
NKLAFWYRLAQWMRSGEIVPMPMGYQLSPMATKVYGRIVALGFIKQVALFRLIVGNTGIAR